MSANQILKVDGKLVVSTDMNTSDANKGSIYFESKQGSQFLGGMRFFGTPQARLIIDSSGGANGMSIRSSKAEGTAGEGGTGKDYALSVTSYQVSACPQLQVFTASTFRQGTENGDPLFLETRYGTANAGVSPQTRYITRAEQSVMKTGESIYNSIGSGSTGYLLHGCTNSTPSRRYLAVTSSYYNEPISCIEFGSTGDVTIPTNLTAGTINAATYLNLPALTPAQILPITLDTTNNRVGVNKTVPTEALDVTGNILASGSITGSTLAGTLSTAAQPNITSVGTLGSLGVTGFLTAGTINATTYLNLPALTPAQILPITLDTTNNRVGVNTTSPGEALDVVGNIHATGSIFGSQLLGDSVLVDNVTAITLGGTISTAAQPNITSVGTLGSLAVTGATTTNTLTLVNPPAKTTETNVLYYNPTSDAVSYGTVPAPTVDVLPITLDKTNNRVGINNTTPTEALDVAGNIKATTLVGYIGTAAQPYITSVGTLYSLAVNGSTTTNTLNISNPPAKTTETNILYYNPTSKAVSYGAVSGGSGTSGTILNSFITADKAAITTNSAPQNINSITLTPGIWILNAYLVTTITANGSMEYGFMSTGSAMTASNPATNFFTKVKWQSVNPESDTFSHIINTTTNLTLYLMIQKLNGGNLTVKANSGMKAVQIAL